MTRVDAVSGDGLVVDRVEDGLFDRATATFDAARVYRYALTRTWDDALPVVTFVMLNPSTADALKVDPTIRRCLDFAKREGAGALRVVNLFALRSTDPRALYSHPDPIGPANDDHIASAAETSDVVIAAWGAHGALDGRGAAVRRSLPRVRCLAVTKDGHPGHPLYLRSDASLVPYAPGVTPAVSRKGYGC